MFSGGRERVHWEQMDQERVRIKLSSKRFQVYSFQVGYF